MFKWPETPNPSAPEHELADYNELDCWKHNRTSVTALSRDLGRVDDPDYSDGVPEDDDTDQVGERAYSEIERRTERCGDGYPFEVALHGYSIRLHQTFVNFKQTIYKYLLLATRLNMNDNRLQAGIDGTLLFEELAAEAARNYLGVRAKSLVFGTAAGADFSKKVNELCMQLQEGLGFMNRDDLPTNAKDGKLDVVVWKPFTDQLPGKIIGFGQCKTGTDYTGSLSQLQPDTFCSKWFKSSPIITPVRMFFIAEALPQGHWNSVSSDAGILFDRCRIVDFCDDVDQGVLDKVIAWTQAAAESNGLPVSP